MARGTCTEKWIKINQMLLEAKYIQALSADCRPHWSSCYYHQSERKQKKLRLHTKNWHTHTHTHTLELGRVILVSVIIVEDAAESGWNISVPWRKKWVIEDLLDIFWEVRREMFQSKLIGLPVFVTSVRKIRI